MSPPYFLFLERKRVDGCAIFYKTTKFTLVKEHLVEFNQLAMSLTQNSPTGAGGSLAGRATNSNFIPDPFSKMESSIGQEAKLKIPLLGRRILFSSVPFSNYLVLVSVSQTLERAFWSWHPTSFQT